MVTLRNGSIFDSRAQVLVNTVNTVGVMGAGLALTFKMMFPKMFKQYKEFCKQRLFNVGQLWLYTNSNRWSVLNFPTKKHWKDYSEIEYIHWGLRNFCKTWQERGIASIAFPMLGCKNGGLKVEDVLPVMREYLDPLPIPIEIWIQERDDPYNPIWNELVEACVDNDTTFKRIVNTCESFEELVKMPGISKDNVGKDINKLLHIEP